MSTGSTPTPSSSPERGNIRGKIDPTWGHCKEITLGDGRSSIVCLYCTKPFKGDGISRFKQHLAGIRGDTNLCKKVPPEVHSQMEQLLIQDVAATKSKAVEEYTEKNSNGSELMGEEPKSVDDYENVRSKSSINDKGKKKVGMTSYFPPRSTLGA
ncbi:hypothetical protein L6164_001221 [Bauhinia variegata]|uniref:Uncharacterized protein n=1 Tax=Bauhinia variegata TaxID=167791 RepID=A0ACB9QFH1_BAUVA|nr:hypothetical protein L6164_001221 [Bauhinia variegata]